MSNYGSNCSVSEFRTVDGDPFVEVRLDHGDEVVVADVQRGAGGVGAEPLDLGEVAGEEPVARPADALRAELPGDGPRPPHEVHQRVERPRGQHRRHGGRHHPDETHGGPDRWSLKIQDKGENISDL